MWPVQQIPFFQQIIAQIPSVFPTLPADPPQPTPGPTELLPPQLAKPIWYASQIANVGNAWASSLSPNPPLPPVPPVPPVAPSTAVLALQVLNGGGDLVAGSTEFLSVLLTDMSNVFVTDVPGDGGPIPLPPPASVWITLITPSKRVKVNTALMTADVSVLGKFDFVYQSVNVDEHGLWLASFTASDGFGSVASFPKRPAFRIVHGSLTH